MSKILLIALGIVIVLAGYSLYLQKQGSDIPDKEGNLASTTETTEAKTDSDEVTSSSSEETQEEEVASQDVSLISEARVPEASEASEATEQISQPGNLPAPVEESILVQPFDNEPQVTGIPCSTWECRDEYGRGQAEVQNEWVRNQPVPGTDVPFHQAQTPAGQDLARQMAGTAPCTSVQCKRGY